MRNSKRLLATLLTLCIMASFICTGTVFAADEAEVTLTFPANIVNVNGTASLSLSGVDGDVTYESLNTDYATVDAQSGVVTGMKIGNATIVAKQNDEEIARIEIPVVGENLLIRNGVNHGKFEGGTDSAFTTNNFTDFLFSNSSVTKVHFWWSPAFGVYSSSVEVVSGMETETADSVNVLKIHYDEVTHASTAKGSQFALRSHNALNQSEEYADYAAGAILADTGRLYEFSGWIKYDEGTGLKDTGIRVIYNTENGADVVNSDGNKATWLSAGKDADSVSAAVTSWQYFSTVPMARENHQSAVAAQIYMNAGYSGASSTVKGNVYVADLSFHEVDYDLKFTASESVDDLKKGTSVSTKIEHLSTTGAEILKINAAGTGRQSITVDYETSDADVATVSDAGVITAVGAGEAVISAKATVGVHTEIREIAVTVEKDIVAAFTPDNTDDNADYTEPTVITISKDGMADISSSKNSDGTHTISAPEENGEGNKFLYWAKGLSGKKKILLGKTNVITDYIPEDEGRNYLIPVYENDITTDEYYNANGQLIPDVDQNDRVTMPGYGTSNGWEPYGENIYVATYELDKPEKNITITPVNCTLNSTEKYAFGDTVTCTASGTEGNFKCWKKYGEIVSCDATYTFKAWEDCTVEAVYVENSFVNAMDTVKIIIDSFSVGSDTGVMAEFIGLGDAVEKGIMFTDSATKKTAYIAMTTKDNQFTVTADKAGTYVGYAILRNGNAFTLITDGIYTKK